VVITYIFELGMPLELYFVFEQYATAFAKEYRMIVGSMCSNQNISENLPAKKSWTKLTSTMTYTGIRHCIRRQCMAFFPQARHHRPDHSCKAVL
jgi:hypothetical protein